VPSPTHFGVSGALLTDGVNDGQCNNAGHGQGLDSDARQGTTLIDVADSFGEGIFDHRPCNTKIAAV
jgi:hypothetical protein